MVTSVLTLSLATWAVGLATVGFLFVCLLLVLIILIQRPQGGGLSGAFGAGGGSGQTAFGAKTGDALTIATVSVFVLFLVGAVALNFAIRPSEERPPAEQTSSEQAPAGAAGEAATEDTGTPEEQPEANQETPPVSDEGETPATDPGATDESPAPAEEAPAQGDSSGEGGGR